VRPEARDCFSSGTPQFMVAARRNAQGIAGSMAWSRL